MEQKLEALEQTIKYEFRDRALLRHALTHPSFSGEMRWERTRSNQRLEFLGDAVLELSISDYLYHTYGELEEGELTRKRSSLVFEAALAVCARDIGLGAYLYLGAGEERSNGREKPSILSDAFEALIGAIYLDGGYDAARQFISEFVIADIDDLSLLQDGKSIVQQFAQQHMNIPLRYETSFLEDSPAHNREFRSELYLNNVLVGEGGGHSKKSAEQEAALQAIKRLGIRK